MGSHVAISLGYRRADRKERNSTFSLCDRLFFLFWFLIFLSYEKKKKAGAKAPNSKIALTLLKRGCGVCSATVLCGLCACYSWTSPACLRLPGPPPPLQPSTAPHPALEDRCGNCITHLAFSTARHICLSGYAKTSTRLQVQEHRLLSSL